MSKKLVEYYIIQIKQGRTKAFVLNDNAGDGFTGNLTDYMHEARRFPNEDSAAGFSKYWQALFEGDEENVAYDIQRVTVESVWTFY